VIVLVLVVECMQIAWLVVLTAAWVQQRHRHDRLTYRVGALSKTVTKVSRIRHTGSQPAVGPATRSTTLGRPPPPFPVDPPTTNPIRSTGRHASP
jgi:hypothetical protein